MKESIWNKSKKIEGRDSERWRYDAAGNPVLKAATFRADYALEYDHIIAFKKGGRSTEDNCQILHWEANCLKAAKVMELSELKLEHLLNKELMD